MRENRTRGLKGVVKTSDDPQRAPHVFLELGIVDRLRRGVRILHLLTSQWVGVKDFGSQNGVEEEVDAVQCPRSRDTASR